MFWWIVATLSAFFVKGLCGFANTLVFTTILSFGVNNINISPVELLLGYPTNLILVWRERKSIRWEVCLPLAVLVVLGSIPGIVFLKHTDTTAIKLVFGVVIVAIGLEMLLRERHTQKGAAQSNRVALTVIGLLSGLLCGLYGIGALLGAYVGRVTEDTSAFKANLCFVFAVENTLRILFYTLWGIITLNALRQALLLAPVMLTGLFLGMQSGRFIEDKLVKRLVIVLLILSGAVLVANQLC